jgi:hypothetical protein
MADSYWENQPAEGSPEWVTANALSEPPADWQAKPQVQPAEQPQEPAAPAYEIPYALQSDPVAQSFAEHAATAGLDQKAVSEALGWYEQRSAEAAEQMTERDATDKYQARNELRWGSNFNSNVSKINDFLNVSAPPGLRDVLANARFPDGRAVCNDAATLQWLLGLSSRQQMPAAAPAAQSQGVEEEIARIERKSVVGGNVDGTRKYVIQSCTSTFGFAVQAPSGVTFLGTGGSSFNQLVLYGSGQQAQLTALSSVLWAVSPGFVAAGSSMSTFY